jgi:hypothetical protein
MRLRTREGLRPKIWFALACVVLGAAACSVEPLMPGSKGGSGGAAGQGGAGGTGGFGGTTGGGGTSGNDCGPPPPVAPCRVGRTVVECITDAMGSHWTVSCPDETDAGGAPCISTGSCATGEVCTTEDGVCLAPPGCTTAGGCPAVCYGNCRPGGACMTDADCRLEADYCTGCDCRALATGQMLAPCPGPGVRCLRDPCSDAKAACVNGSCVVQ